MGNWVVSISWKGLVVYSLGFVILRIFNAREDDFVLFGLLGGLLLMFYIMITLAIIHTKFESVITNIIIPEFIDKRPFREIDIKRKETILQEILDNVNDKVQLTIGVNYPYSDTFALLDKYKRCMLSFEHKLNKVYRNLPVEDNILEKFSSGSFNMDKEHDKKNKPYREGPVEIRGWDKIMLIARNIENEDVEYVMRQEYSPELIEIYGTIREN